MPKILINEKRVLLAIAFIKQTKQLCEVQRDVKDESDYKGKNEQVDK